MTDLRELVVEIVAEEDAAAVTPGLVRMRLEERCGRDYDHSEVFDLMHRLESEGVLQYHLGEYNEFSIPDGERH